MKTLFTPAGSWVALVTPMDADGAVDRQAVARLVDAHVAAGTTGLVLGGTTGESAALDGDDYDRLLDAGLTAAAGRIPVLAGVGSPATARAVALARQATAAGADGLLCVTPYYLRTTQQGLEAHYHAVVEAVDRPIVLYNVPKRTGVDLLPSTVASLSQVERIVGIKEAVPERARIEQLVAACAEGFAILSGDDPSSLSALEAGAVGVISVTGNVVPRAIAALCRAAAAGRWDEARSIHARLEPLHAALAAEPNPMPVKALLARLGKIEATIRLPLVPASPSLVTQLETLLHESFQTEHL